MTVDEAWRGSCGRGGALLVEILLRGSWEVQQEGTRKVSFAFSYATSCVAVKTVDCVGRHNILPLHVHTQAEMWHIHVECGHPLGSL